jgi:hypothetical protein
MTIDPQNLSLQVHIPPDNEKLHLFSIFTLLPAHWSGGIRDGPDGFHIL